MNNIKNRIDIDLIAKAEALLYESEKIAIIPHSGPDGDAIGSSLALYQYLKKKGKMPKIVSPSAYPVFLNWLPKNSEVMIYTNGKKAAEEYLKSSDLVFIVDHNSFKRSGDLEKILQDLPAKKIMIDHHPEPEQIVDVMFSDTSMCATCELMYEFIEALGDENLIDTHIAECLYTGIVTDTGGLSYNSSNPRTYQIVGDLLARGIDKSKIHSNVYDNFSTDRMKLLGHCLDRGLEVLPEYQTAIITLTKEDLLKFNYKDGDTEGFVNYPLSIQGMLVSVIFIEKEDMVKISFRSKGNVPINAVAAEYFNGGGHMNAAGGRTTDQLKDAIAKFKEVLPAFYKSLNQ
ncbi:DHH family phosphoesterase [Marinifilum caeruleilacunae]|uniref:Bifunctional oligoribonuclease/PAP phosphatase NrnA n=1 Tax=Marinifilum caeruleilacunae TaxID=2499076 RepID=A0ABX1WX63_9BACT|nr:bifunctional oligoribonuclease/PAP phosphatase NrnA [Marinifilum caeruleilacunae]NOU60701.1 bifunctional oligoribonuclease/PAP phosphatase NrnA [Marinifilum caeruleilacunae]